MTLTQAMTWLDKRIGGQYNADADAQELLKLWINAACRKLWELTPLGFNETSTSTIPTITSDQFTLPDAAISLMELKKSTGSGSANYEVDVPFHQEGRTITILDTGATPTRMSYHSFYTNVTTGSSSISTYLDDYLVIELAAYFSSGERKDPTDMSGSQINKSDSLMKDWARKFSISRKRTSAPFRQDGVQIDRQSGGVYSAGSAQTTTYEDTKGWNS